MKLEVCQCVVVQIKSDRCPIRSKPIHPASLPGDRSSLPIGVVLAGGRGRRLGGTEKSFLELDGRPLLAHVLDRVGPQVSELIVNTNSVNDRYLAFELQLCRDTPRAVPSTGPLVGVTSVFGELDKRGDAHASLLSVPVDTPFLPSDLVRCLVNALTATQAPVAYAATAERDHPIVALWGPQSRLLVRRLFEERPSISLHDLMSALNAARVVFAHTPHDPFFNINRASDLEAAERIVRSAEGSGNRKCT